MRKLATIFALFFLAPAAFAAVVTVGCPGGTPGTYPSIGAALAALDTQGPNTINVSGNCNESVVLDQRERLTIQGPATITGTANFGIQINNSGNIALRNLTVSAPRTGISVGNKSAAVLTGIDATAPLGIALDIFGGATGNIGGFNAADAVLLHDSFTGMRIEASVVFVPGWLTVEDNSSNGIFVDSGRLEALGTNPTPPTGGPVVVRNNFAGINVQSGGFVELARQVNIENNLSNGILATTGSVVYLNNGTIVEGHPRCGVGVLFNSTLRATGANIIRNNGTTTDQFRCGISVNHNSMVWLGGGQIINNTGRGILADSGSSVRVDNATISGNSEEGMLLLHGAIFESIGGNTIPANGTGSVKCDATTIVFGDFTGVAAFECEKKEKEK